MGNRFGNFTSMEEWNSNQETSNSRAENQSRDSLTSSALSVVEAEQSNSSYNSDVEQPERVLSGFRREELEDGHSSVRQYYPSFLDYIVIFRNLYRSNKLSLPSSLIVDILMYADYFPRTYAHRNFQVLGRDFEDSVYLEFPVTSRSPLFRPYAIVFSVISRDQGWSSFPRDHGTRNGSYTWGEASLNVSPSVRYHIYTNIHAGRDWETQAKVFDESSPLVQTLNQHLIEQDSPSECDSTRQLSIQLRSRSLYPGWKNSIQQAIITILWNVRDIDLTVGNYSTSLRTFS